MRGRDVHDNKTRINKDYLRKRLVVVEKYQEPYLANEILRGKVDEALRFDDGTMAPLDYKFAQYKDKVFNTYKTQLACYSWLIEDNFDTQVQKGFLVYTRSNHKVVEVEIDEELKNRVKDAAKDIVNIIGNNRYPKATPYKKRCLECTYRNICIK